MRAIQRITRVMAVLCLIIGGVATASAQKNVNIGLAAGIATYNGGGYADAFLQFDVAPHVRIAPEIGYIFRNDGKNGMEVSVDVQLPFRLARGLSVYPLMGATYNYWDFGHDHTASRLGFDIGAGVDISLTSRLKLIIQGKGSLMNDTGGGFFEMGFGYAL